MKTNVVLTAILAICLCHAQAQPEALISPSLADKFAAEFPDATNLRWTIASGVTLASFLSGDQFLIVYYDTGGQRLATERKVSDPILLPILVRQALDKSCDRLGTDIRMGPVFELVIGSSTQYLVSVENREKIYALKFDTMGNRTVMNKRPS